MVFEPDRVGQNCEFCGSPALVAYEEIKAPIRPQSLLPFKIDAGRVRDDLRRWLAQQVAGAGPARRARRSSTPSAASTFPTGRSTRRSTARGTPRPVTTTTCRCRTATARAVRSVRQERRVRWEPASGVVDHVFDDEPVPGTHGIPVELLRRVEPFPTPKLVPYDTAFLVRARRRALPGRAAEAAPAAPKPRCTRGSSSFCDAQVPGDTYRNLRIYPEYSDRTFKHILVPVWLLSYNFGPKAFQVVVNGYTGRSPDVYPYSSLEDPAARAGRDRRDRGDHPRQSVVARGRCPSVVARLEL